jgi:lysophospholipase L1-like esterase
LHALLVAAASLVTAQALLYAQNTLDANGEWTSGKVELERGVMGAAATMVTRVPLARNRLNLGAYFGYQQLLHGEDRAVAALTFDLEIARKGYVDVLYGPSAENLSGVRLSASPLRASLHYRVDSRGAFRDAQPLELTGLRELNLVRLVFGEGVASLELNDAPPISLPRDDAQVYVVGFRGCIHPVWVDDVAIIFRDGSRAFADSFGNEGNRWSLLAATAAGFALLSLVGQRSVRRLRGLDSRRAHLLCIVVYLGVIPSALAYFAVDYFYFSGLYPERPAAVDFGSYEPRLEDSEAVLERLRGLRSSLEHAECFRVLMIGTSQTWGSGARRAEDTVDRVLEERLGPLVGSGRGVCVINASIPGLVSGQLLHHYRREWAGMKPDLVIVTLGNNDRAVQPFQRALEGFAASNRKRGIDTLFVLEPNSPEAFNRLGARHKVMRQVAREFGIPVLDMHQYLRSRHESGFVWWDSVHLTSWGQELFAEQLASEIARRV